uniref:Uncharacterized protein n=1 Tax=Tanacetum cinerariifolium TaxID=118510 RepID=A0A699HBT8_TANCI|nr:hypothetical protein [Tanacetum cinerariifolium]
MLTEDIKQTVLLPDLYQILHWLDTSKKSRGKGSQGKQQVVTSKKKVLISVDDNIIPELDVALELGKSISLVKAKEEEEAARSVHATHECLVSESNKLISKSANRPTEQLAVDTMQALKASKKISRIQPHARGSSEGTGVSPGVSDESTFIVTSSSERTGTRPVVPNEVNDSSKANGDSIIDWDLEKESEYSEKEKVDEEIKQLTTNEVKKKKDDDEDDRSIDNEKTDDDEETDDDFAHGDEYVHDNYPSILTVSVSIIPKPIDLSPVPEIPLVTPATTLPPPPSITNLTHVLQQTTKINRTPLITTVAPTATTVSYPLPIITQRVYVLEKDVKELKQIDPSSAILATIRSHVPAAVDEYLRSSLGDSLQKVTMGDEEPVQENVNNANQPKDGEAAPKNDWFKQPPRPPTLNPEWNICQSSIELEYNRKECNKSLPGRFDWGNPKGDRCPSDLSKPLSLKGHLGHLIVAAEYFFNNDLEYLKSTNSERKYTTSITKTKAARPSFEPPGVVYEELNYQKRLMRADELYEFSDGMLKKVYDTLHHMLLNF